MFIDQTAYEIIARKDGKSIRLNFSARKTRGALIESMQKFADKIVAELGTDENASAPVINSKIIKLSDGTEVTFSGNTYGDLQRGQIK